MVKIAFSYSHEDETLRNELEKHLSALKRQNLIETWHDRRILAGQEFDGEIDKNFEEAGIILLLVSPDFIASDYCYNVEMSRAIKRHDQGTAKVIPIILRPCDWHDLPFGKLLAATTDGKAIVNFPSYDHGFLEVVIAIKQAIKSIGNHQANTTISKSTEPEIHQSHSVHNERSRRIGNSTAHLEVSHLRNPHFCTLRSSVWPVSQSAVCFCVRVPFLVFLAYRWRVSTRQQVWIAGFISHQWMR